MGARRGSGFQPWLRGGSSFANLVDDARSAVVRRQSSLCENVRGLAIFAGVAFTW
jgi:hypothetical protein